MITTLQLNSTPLTHKELHNPYEMHRTLERVFDGNSNRCLWRREEESVVIRHTGALALSNLPPGYVKEATGSKKETYSVGTWLPFRLVANPVEMVGDNRKGEVRKRRVITGPDRLTRWLAFQGERGGFRLHDCSISRSRNWMPKNPKGIRIVAHEFRGVLEVTNEERFNQTLYNGIGKGKGFGLGMIHII